MTARAGHVELHAVGALLDGALAFALRTHARLLDHSIAVAIRAGVLARDVQAHAAAASRRSPLAARPFEHVIEIESAEIERNALALPAPTGLSAWITSETARPGRPTASVSF